MALLIFQFIKYEVSEITNEELIIYLFIVLVMIMAAVLYFLNRTKS